MNAWRVQNRHQVGGGQWSAWTDAVDGDERALRFTSERDALAFQAAARSRILDALVRRLCRVRFEQRVTSV